MSPVYVSSSSTNFSGTGSAVALRGGRGGGGGMSAISGAAWPPSCPSPPCAGLVMSTRPPRPAALPAAGRYLNAAVASPVDCLEQNLFTDDGLSDCAAEVSRPVVQLARVATQRGLATQLPCQHQRRSARAPSPPTSLSERDT
eukprot:366238-Chlamydomonas_euryale.AAC.18